MSNQRNLLLEANADLNPNQAVKYYSLNPHEIACHFRTAKVFGSLMRKIHEPSSGGCFDCVKAPLFSLVC